MPSIHHRAAAVARTAPLRESHANLLIESFASGLARLIETSAPAHEESAESSESLLEFSSDVWLSGSAGEPAKNGEADIGQR